MDWQYLSDLLIEICLCFNNFQGPYVEQPNATVASTVRALVVTIFEQTCFAY